MKLCALVLGLLCAATAAFQPQPRGVASRVR
jgi:hypothetical protein